MKHLLKQFLKHFLKQLKQKLKHLNETPIETEGGQLFPTPGLT